MEYWYEVKNNRFPAPENKPISRGGTEKTPYKEVWFWNGIYIIGGRIYDKCVQQKLIVLTNNSSVS